MAIDIPIPQITAPDPTGKLRQMQSYLIQLAGLLNFALNTADAEKAADAGYVKTNDTGTESFAALRSRFNAVYASKTAFENFTADTYKRLTKLEADAKSEVFSGAEWNEGQELSAVFTSADMTKIKNGRIFAAVTSNGETLLCISDGQRITGTAVVQGGRGALSVGATATHFKYQTDVDMSSYLPMLGYDSEGKSTLAVLSAEGREYSFFVLDLAKVHSSVVYGYALCFAADDLQTGEVLYTTVSFDFSSVYPWLKTSAVGWQSEITDIAALTGTEAVTVTSLFGGISFLNGTVITYADESITTFAAEMTAEYTDEATKLTLSCARKLRHLYGGSHGNTETFTIKQLSIMA